MTNKKAVEYIVSTMVIALVITAGTATGIGCMKAHHVGHAMICFVITLVFSFVSFMNGPWV